MKHYILDAHNIMHKSPVISDILDIDLLEARKALLEEVAEYSDQYPSYKFSVVFDGRASKVNAPRSQIIVLRSGTTKIADTVIKELVREENVPSLCIVVSSDSDVYNFARLHSCTAMISEDFLKEISKFKLNEFEMAEQLAQIEKPEDISSGDYINLLDAFSPGEAKRKTEARQKIDIDRNIYKKKKLKKYLENDIQIEFTSDIEKTREKPEDPDQREIDEMKKLFGI